MSHKYHFNVAMSCSGCSNAVNKALSRLEGENQIEISLENQTVDVTTDKDYDTIYNAISKTGKKIVEGKVVQ